MRNSRSDYLHFSVPDKGPLTDYATWMPDFMQGMAKGIEKSRSLIQGAIKNVSGDMVITPNVSAMLNGNKNNSASAISSSSNQNITYNFNQTNNSPKSLSRFEIYRQSKNLLSTVKGR